jgi:hypothetical protein
MSAKRKPTEGREQQGYEPLPPETLEELPRETPFPGWARYVDPMSLRGARRVLRETIAALIALGPDAPEPARLDELHQCVERLNLLDGTDQFICTVEREDICELLDRIGAMIGLDDYGEELGGNREW